MLSAFLIRDLAAPRSLLANPARFGGRVDGDLLRGDLLIVGQRVIGMAGADLLPPARVIEGRGRILLPALTEPHLHLDKAFTLPRLPSVGGNLMAAIAAQEADKANWSDTDLRSRAERALGELQAAGVARARSHVDWGTQDDPTATPRAWDVLAEVAQDWAGRVDLQLSALPAIDLCADLTVASRIAAEVARVNGCLGAWSLNHANRQEGFAALFDQAARRGLPLDFHVDEGQDMSLDGLSLIVAEALRTRFEGPVLCGHAVSLANLSGAPLDHLLADMARAGVSLCALPTTNLYLQSRGAGTPDRRGLTRLIEASEAGVTTCLGTDNVQDAFYPAGRHDPLLTLSLAVPSLHLDPPLGRHLPLVTAHAALAMGHAPDWIDRCGIARLHLAEATNLAELATAPARLSLASWLSRP